jgi:Tol biopolymer transport system component
MKPGHLPIPFLVALLACLLSSASSAQTPNPLADTPWPMYQHDPQHTGRSPFLGPLHKLELHWTYDNPICLGENGGGVIAPGGDLIYSLGRCLYRFDPIKRKLVWRFSGYPSRSVPLLARDSSIYWGYGPMFAKFQQDGKITWNAVLDQNNIFGSSPAFGPDGNLYVDHDALWSFTPDGEMRWYIPHDWFSHLSPAFDVVGGLYWDWCKYQLSGELVARAWCAPGPGSFSQGQTAIGSDGTAYISDTENNGKLVAFDPQGNILWSFDPLTMLPGQSYYSPFSPAISPDSTIYYSLNSTSGEDPNSHLLAVQPDGKLKWERAFSQNLVTTFSPTFRTPLTVDRAGNVNFCVENSHCYGINPDNEILWDFEFPLENSISRFSVVQPLIAADGLLYLVDNLDRLYALADPALFSVLTIPPYLPTFQIEPGHSAITTTIPVSSTTSSISYTVNISDTNWMSINVATGQTPSEIQLRVDPANLPVGVYRGSIQFKSSHLTNQVVNLPVTLNVGRNPVFLPVIENQEPDRILFTSNWFQEIQITSILPNGRDRIVHSRLSPSQYDNLYFSPNGIKVAFSVVENNRHKIQVYNLLDGQRILEIENAHFSGSRIWSPDSQQIIFLSLPPGKTYSEIFRVNIDGSGLVQLTNSQLGFTSVHLSPDGSKIALQASWNKTYLMNADGSQLTDFFPDGSNNIPLSWSPDNRYLLTMEAGSSAWVWVNDLRTNKAWKLSNKVSNLNDISWSPDSSQVAFIGPGQGDWDLYVINLEGGEAKNLTSSDIPERQIAWSPEGDWIVYTGHTFEELFAENYDLYIVRPDGSDRQKITVNVGDDMNPFWVR